MKTLTLAIASVVAALATPAFAQTYYYERSYGSDPYVQRTERPAECYNPRAGHFEAVRPGEYQEDLDFSRCRVIGQRWSDRQYGERQAYRTSAQECWNPRARQFEEVRPNERQEDLDFNRCRVSRDRVAYDRYDGYRWR